MFMVFGRNFVGSLRQLSIRHVFFLWKPIVHKIIIFVE